MQKIISSYDRKNKLSLSAVQKQLNAASDFIETKNFYFEKHQCGDNEEISVKMDYKLKDDISGDIVKFGFCPHCGICYYHNDYENK